MIWQLAAIAALTFAPIAGKPDDFGASSATVWFFVATDCPIANSYAPEIERIAESYKGKVRCFLMYPDPDTTPAAAAHHAMTYHLTLPPVPDPRQIYMRRAGAKVTPEAALYDHAGNLEYLGRIDDRWTKLGTSRLTPHHRDLRDAIDAVLAGKKPLVSRTAPVGCYVAAAE